MANFGPLAAEIRWRVWGTQANFNGFRAFAALLHGTLVEGVSQWASAKRCGVEQRAPPIFGKAAITLGIGPHSSFCLNWLRKVGRPLIVSNVDARAIFAYISGARCWLHASGANE